MDAIKKAIIIIAIIFVIAGIVIMSNGDYNLNQKQDLFNFFKAYGSWIGNVVKNVADITAYAVKKPWLPQ